MVSKYDSQGDTTRPNKPYSKEKLVNAARISGIQLRRMAQLARDRKYRHETVDRETFLVCAARLLKVRTDLSGVTIRRWANSAHIVLDQHDLVIVDGVRNNPDDPFLDHETLGRMLRLTTDERDRIDFRNAWPFDVPREDTKARRAAKKREADRARNEQKRRAADKQPRAEYLANANAAKARALGVSRATYYRNRLHETGPSHHDETGVSRHDGETCGYRHDETGPSPTSKRRKKEGAATNLSHPTRHKTSKPRASSRPQKAQAGRKGLSRGETESSVKPKAHGSRSRQPRSGKAGRKRAIQGVIPMPAVAKSNGLHPGGAPPSRNLITLAGFAHHDNGVKFVWSISADFLLACGLAGVKSVSIEARSDGWVRIAEGDDFKLHAAHQTKQIYLYRRRMSRYRNYSAVEPFKAINCLAVIGRGYLDVKLPTTVEAKRAERKAA